MDEVHKAPAVTNVHGDEGCPSPASVIKKVEPAGVVEKGTPAALAAKSADNIASTLTHVPVRAGNNTTTATAQPLDTCINYRRTIFNQSDDEDTESELASSHAHGKKPTPTTIAREIFATITKEILETLAKKKSAAVVKEESFGKKEILIAVVYEILAAVANEDPATVVKEKNIFAAIVIKTPDVVVKKESVNEKDILPAFHASNHDNAPANLNTPVEQENTATDVPVPVSLSQKLTVLKNSVPRYGMTYKFRVKLTTNIRRDKIISDLLNRKGYQAARRRGFLDVDKAFVPMFEQAIPFIQQIRNENGIKEYLPIVKNQLDWGKEVSEQLFSELFEALEGARRAWCLNPREPSNKLTPLVLAIDEFRRALNAFRSKNPRVFDRDDNKKSQDESIQNDLGDYNNVSIYTNACESDEESLFVKDDSIYTGTGDYNDAGNSNDANVPDEGSLFVKDDSIYHNHDDCDNAVDCNNGTYSDEDSLFGKVDSIYEEYDDCQNVSNSNKESLVVEADSSYDGFLHDLNASEWDDFGNRIDTDSLA
ncbi:hypothetical protein F5Y16DRAFT_398773 [Xylariaceae sp. FL0255]|nr:hypothetical protein F5Y16DRAFT_398773 [Xylariaceae sp. FL0255]